MTADETKMAQDRQKHAHAVQIQRKYISSSKHETL